MTQQSKMSIITLSIGWSSIIGEIGYKLHTGRSRNEQIATDLRLYVREQIDEIAQLLAEFCSVDCGAGRSRRG